MKTSRIEQRPRLLMRLSELGFSLTEADQLRRIASTLHRWAELECGMDRGNIQRDEVTGQPYFHGAGRMVCGQWFEPRPYAIQDRERGALARLSKLMARHPALWSYHQADPRGCSLYVGRKTDLSAGSLDSQYTRGVAICG